MFSGGIDKQHSTVMGKVITVDPLERISALKEKLD